MSIKITVVYFLCKDITLLTKYMIILVERKCIDLKCLYGSLQRWCVASCNCIIYTSSLMAPCNHRCPALRFGVVGSALLGLLKKKMTHQMISGKRLLKYFHTQWFNLYWWVWIFVVWVLFTVSRIWEHIENDRKLSYRVSNFDDRTLIKQYFYDFHKKVPITSLLNLIPLTLIYFHIQILMSRCTGPPPNTPNTKKKNNNKKYKHKTMNTNLSYDKWNFPFAFWYTY